MNTTAVRVRPGLIHMLLRGLFRRCAWCGGKGAFFISWFKRDDRCHTCGLLWQRRLEGFELGAMTMNVMVSYGVLLAGMGVGVFLTYPDVAVVPLLAVVGSLAIVLPIFMYPISYGMWLGVDIFMRDLEPEELADAAAAVAAKTQ
ncbi:MAG: hypothetical protein WCL35_10050 [bacterium]